MESLIKKKKKNWPFSTRDWWARVLFMIPKSIKLGYHSILATYFITISKLTLSIFWNPAYPHSHSYSLITHSLNVPLTLSIYLSTLSDFLNLAIKLSHTLSISLSVSLSLSFSISLSLLVSLSQGMSHSACIFSLSIGYLWVYVFVNFVFLCIIWFWVMHNLYFFFFLA